MVDEEEYYEVEREREAARWQDGMSQGEYLTEAVRQYAQVYGAEEPEKPWILSPFDTWERNPYYSGPPVPHPEDYDYDEYQPTEMEEWLGFDPDC